MARPDPNPRLTLTSQGPRHGCRDDGEHHYVHVAPDDIFGGLTQLGDAMRGIGPDNPDRTVVTTVAELRRLHAEIMTPFTDRDNDANWVLTQLINRLAPGTMPED